MIFIRKCPLCSVDILYKTQKRMQNASKIKSKCKKCQGKAFKLLYKGTYTRKCKICGKTIFYTSKYTYKVAESKGRNCLQCFLKNKNVEYGKKHRGKYHPCYGRKPSLEERNKVSKASTGRIQSEETKRKRFFSRFKITYDEYLNSLDEWSKYKKLVINETKKQPLNNLKNYNLRGKYSYHLDHIIPIFYGFKNKVPPLIIGNINNLQMIWWKENLKKSYKV